MSATQTDPTAPHSARPDSSARPPAGLAATARLEQHQTDWNNRADKVARENNGLDRADCSSQPGLAALVPAGLLDLLLGRLALFFLTNVGDDLAAARDTAAHMLLGFDPRTEDELHLAAEVVSFSFHALEALGQAVDPALSLNQKLRLRTGAVSLNRESHKSRRQLEQIQKARRAHDALCNDNDALCSDIDRTGMPPQPQVVAPAATSTPPTCSPPASPAIKAALDAALQPNPVGLGPARQMGTLGNEKRQRAMQIAENLRRNQLAHQAAAQPPAADAVLSGLAARPAAS